MHFLVKGFAAIAGATLSLQALAASFEVPSFYEIMYIDKKGKSALSLSKSKADLSAGPHQVVVRYSDVVGSNSNSAIVKSQPIVINLQVQQGQEIELVAKQPRRGNQAESYARNPTFTLKSNKGAVDYQHYVLPVKPGMQFSRDYLEEIAEIEANDSSKALAATAATTTAVAATTASASTTAPAATSTAQAASSAPAAETAAVATVAPETMPQIDAGDNTALQMMQFWYQRADEATRKQFQIWVIQQQ